MGAHVTSLRSSTESYYSQLPNGMKEKVASSFLFSLAINTFTSDGNPTAALKGGAIAAITSFIDSALRPILNKISFFDRNNPISVMIQRQFIVLAVVNLGLVALSPILGLSVTIDFVSSFVIYYIWMLFSNNPNPRDAQNYYFYQNLLV